MSYLKKIELLLLPFFLLTVSVQCLNYYYVGPRSTSYPREPSPSAAVKTTTVSNQTRNRIQRYFSTPYTIFYPLTFPQSRGGRNLNLALASKPSTARYVQPRIVNRPEVYPHFAIPLTTFKTVSNAHSLPQKSNIVRRIRYTNPNSPKDVNVNLPKKLHNIETIFIIQPEGVGETKKFRQSKGVKLSSLQHNHKLPKNVFIGKPKVTTNNTNSGYQVQSYPQSFQKVESQLGYQRIVPNWPCFCVPYYLCKNGFINSGGRSVAALNRQTKSSYYKFGNVTNISPQIQAAYVIETVSGKKSCEGNKICCKPSFGDNSMDRNHYPVATPPPDPYYTVTPRYQVNNKDFEQCGIRRAYGIQGRLTQLQYPADVAEFGEYPWQVAILRKVVGDKSLYLCGGVLISPQWVATAAHCLNREQVSPLQIRLGEWDVNRKDEVYPYVEKDVNLVILHPDFHPETLFNDLALIRMKSPVDPRIPHVTPACLPRRGIVYENTKCWVSGWGKDFFGPQGEYQNVLKEVDVPVIGRSICTEQLQSTNLGSDFALHPGFLCAGGQAGKDACTGDGGSPLVCQSGSIWYVVGLVSWGVGCGQPNVPGIYVNLLYYIDWIHSIVWR